MSFTLYVRADCHDCHRVINWMAEEEIPFTLDDIDAPKAAIPRRLFIAPALCQGVRLCAYGMDIITYLEQHFSRVQASGSGRVTSS